MRRLVLANGIVPLGLLAYDAWRHQLGANGTTYALHTTGALALILFLLSLVITPLQRLTGWKELVAARRALGLYGFFYLVIHVSIFFLFDREASIASTVNEIVKRRYLQLGAIAFLLFVPLAVTATDRMITRLGPRRWKRLHRLTYLATSLGAIHYILLVKSDLRQPVAFAGVLTVLLAYRVVAYVVDRNARARRKPWSGELRVARITDETPDVRTFRFVPAAGGKLPFKHRAGQYLNIMLAVDGQRINRSYTIASAPTHSDYCEITVKNVNGVASRHLHTALREGMAVKVTAPAGRFVFDGGGASQVLLLAGGVGITPLMAMVRTLTDRHWGGRIILVFSVRTKKDIVFAKELEELARRFPELHVHVTLSREPAGSDWSGERGAIGRELLQRVAPDMSSMPIYLCGPEPMMIAMKAVLAELGAPAENIHVEAFVSPPRAPAADQGAVASEEATASDDAPSRSDGAVTVQFLTSTASTRVEEGQSILEAAEEIGVDIPFDCRAGICGQCKTKLVRGRVIMAVQDALTAEDRKHHLILACQAKPVRDVAVEA